MSQGLFHGSFFLAQVVSNSQFSLVKSISSPKTPQINVLAVLPWFLQPKSIHILQKHAKTPLQLWRFNQNPSTFVPFSCFIFHGPGDPAPTSGSEVNSPHLAEPSTWSQATGRPVRLTETTRNETLNSMVKNMFRFGPWSQKH